MNKLNLKLAATGYIVGFTACMIAVGSSYAYGPIQTDDDGVPVVWAGSAPTVTIVPEDGTCPSLSTTDTLTFLQTLTSEINDVTQSTLSVDVTDTSLISIVDGQTAVAGDITSTNAASVLVLRNVSSTGAVPDSIVVNAKAVGQNPIVFDSDGSIIDDIYGTGASDDTIGSASPIADTDTATGDLVIFRSEEVINCRTDLTFAVDDELIKFVILHEMLHGLGLGHSQLHHAAAEDNVASNDSSVPLMYPVAVRPTATLAFDDEMGLATLYPASTLSTTFWTLQGTIEDASGNDIVCANMILEDASNPDSNALSFVTGSLGVFTDDNGDEVFSASECDSNCSQFVFEGLTVGSSYTLSVEPVDSAFVDGSSVGPCSPTNTSVPTVTFTRAFSASEVTTQNFSISCNNTTTCSSATITESSATSSSGGSGGGGCSLTPDTTF